MKTPVASFIALALAAGTLASASVPAPDGVVHACYRKADGRLRVIDTEKGRRCRKSERAVEWNERGRRGRVGPKGDRGPRGQRGLPGAGAPITEHLIDSSEVTEVAAGGDPVSHTTSWTVPEDTIAKAYFRVVLTTPPGACDSEAEASWTFAMNVQTDVSSESYNGAIYPGTTTLTPAGSASVGNALLPGDYVITTNVTRAEFVPACADTVVKTELFVVTEASA